MAFFIIVFPICLLGGFIRSSIGVCNLFFGIARLDSTIEKQMLLWESAYANANDTLFINKIAGILEKYGMHTPMELLINPPSKHMGKTMIKKAINEYWYKKNNEEVDENNYQTP
jgi:hypothetical protein